MRILRTTALSIGLVAAGSSAWAKDASFEAELLSIQNEWAVANFETGDKKARKEAFEDVLGHVSSFREAHPSDVEAVAWEGIVLSSYAGEVGKMSAMKYAKAAREALHEAEKIDPTALDGGIYASLGALYSKVPGGIVGFGDDDLARRYFEKAVAVDSDNLDTSYFYGEFLLEHGEHEHALATLSRGLASPAVASRPAFDAGRRAEIRALIEQASP